ncbi:MAG: 50S ribosomal protein L10 [bacterium]|nr:50S ribosomal protein L10 [bacterium]
MPMKKAEKIQLSENYGEMVEQASSILLFDYRGLTVEQVSDLRGKLRQAGGNMRVVRNRMLKRAIETKAYSEPMSEFLKGPTAVVFSGEDPVGPAKALVEFAKSHEIVKIKCGSVYDAYLAANQVEVLANTPPLEQLHSKILGGIKAPATNLLGLIKGAHNKIHGLIKAYADKLEQAA